MQPLTYVLKTLEKQALNGPPLVTLQCVPALDVKMLPRRVPRPPTLTYVLLTCVLEMPEVRVSFQEYLFTGSSKVTSCGFRQKEKEGALTVLQEPTLTVTLGFAPQYWDQLDLRFRCTPRPPKSLEELG